MELYILKFFETIRCLFGDALAITFSLFGETLFLIILVCLIYWIFSKELGEKLVVTSFSSMSVNGVIKSAVARPRPFVNGVISRVEIDNPLISTMELAPYESFPSGHSQVAGGMFFTGALHFNRVWGWILFPLLVLGVMLSRLYFGVHYPTDTLVGAGLGIAFAFFWHFVYKFAGKNKNFVFAVFALFAGFSLLFASAYPAKSMIELSACALGTAICLPLENKLVNFTDTKSVKKKLLRAVVGIVCVGVVFGGFSFLPFAFLELLAWKFIKYFCVVVTATLFVPFLFKKWNL